MNLRLRVKNANATELLDRYINKKLGFALRRFGDRVGSVSVTVNGNTGISSGSKCHITTELRPYGSFVVEERGPDLLTVIARAAGRVGRRVGSELERIRQLRTTRDSVRLAA
jgi:ribosome-associated translation inhibitor RaiA